MSAPAPLHVTDLRLLFEHHEWANRRMFAALDALTDEEFTAPVAGGHGSIRNTLVHTMSAEWGWLDRCGGAKRGERLKPDDFPTVASLIATWARVERSMREFLAALGDDALTEDVPFAFGDGPAKVATRGELLLHAALHAVHHRGQVAMMLRLLGHEPGAYDFLFFAERSS